MEQQKKVDIFLDLKLSRWLLSQPISSYVDERWHNREKAYRQKFWEWIWFWVLEDVESYERIVRSKGKGCHCKVKEDKLMMESNPF